MKWLDNFNRFHLLQSYTYSKMIHFSCSLHFEKRISSWYVKIRISDSRLGKVLSKIIFAVVFLFSKNQIIFDSVFSHLFKKFEFFIFIICRIREKTNEKLKRDSNMNWKNVRSYLEAIQPVQQRHFASNWSLVGMERKKERKNNDKWVPLPLIHAKSRSHNPTSTPMLAICEFSIFAIAYCFCVQQ